MVERMRFPGIYRLLNNEANNGHNNDSADEIIEIGKMPKGLRCFRLARQHAFLRVLRPPLPERVIQKDL